MSQTTLYKINVDTNGNTVLPQLARNADKADKAVVGLSRDANGKLRDANGRFVSLNKNVKGVGNSLGKSKGKAHSFFSTLNAGGNKSISMMSRLRGLAAGIGLTLGAGALIAGTIGTGAGFEKSMSNVEALTNASKTEMVSLESAAREAGATTAYTARESADAMGYLALAGYDASQQIAALPSTLDLAAAGSVGLARSADIATNILSQYRMQAKDTNVVVDQLAFTQSRFNTNIEEASEAMNYFGPTASAMGISLSESNATIGLMANNGLKGSLATRALGSSIVRLTKPTAQMSKMMKSLNVDFFDSEGRFVGMAGMVGLLNNRLEGMNDKQRQAALSTLFGAEAIQEINILLAEGSGKIKYWTEELDKAEGTAKRMADVKLDNLAGDFQILKSASQETTLQLYNEMGPALRSVTQEATLFVRGMDTKEVGLLLKSTIFQLRSGVIWLGKHKKQIVNLGKAMVVLKAASVAYGVGLRGQGVLMAGITLLRNAQALATGKATIAQIGLNAAMKANPLGLFLGVLTAVISAVTLFRDRTTEARNAQEELNDSIPGGKDTTTLSRETEKDISLLRLSGNNPRQITQIRDNASNRANDAEDILSNALYNIDNKEGKELATLLSKKKNAITLADGTHWDGLDEGDQNKIWSLESVIKQKKHSKELNSLRSIIDKNKSLSKQATSLLPEDGGSKVVVPAANSIDDSGMGESIISGGSQQRVINIKLDKFQDNLNFNIQGDMSEVREGADEMREIVNECFMRILNSANQLANG